MRCARASSRHELHHETTRSLFGVLVFTERIFRKDFWILARARIFFFFRTRNTQVCVVTPHPRTRSSLFAPPSSREKLTGGDS